MKTGPDWPTYLRAITDGELNVRIAERTGVAATTIKRWFSGESNPHPLQVVAVARAYGHDPLRALIIAGHLAENDAPTTSALPRRLQLAEFTKLEIAEELLRRARARAGETAN